MSYRKIKAKYDGKIAGLYDLEGTIGKGHYAVVKLARHVFTGEKVAVKVIDKTKLDDVSRSHLFQEVRCMKLVQHPNIVRLYEVIDTQSKLYLILELGDGGDLYDYIMKQDGGLEEDMAKIYFHQIVQAIAYCHQLHVVHRDLKPENVVFFDKTGSVKLTDFGFSNKFTPGRKLETSCGSLAYSAPEILLGDSYDPPAVDVWSLGVILYMLVCGKPPFQEANDGETLIKIMDCDYTIPSHVSTNCQHLIGKMLVREPSDRISLDNILIHPWLNDGVVLPHPQRALVGRKTLSDDEHSCIVQRIVEGKIASRDEIIHSLERNAYNHITATYYLLAERLLRRRSRQLSEKGTTPSSSASALSPPNVLLARPKSPDVLTMEEHRLNLQKLMPDSPSAPSTPSSPTPPLPATVAALGPPLLAKRCSLIQEELAEEDEEMEVESDALIKLEEKFRKDERSRASIGMAREESGAQSSRANNTGRPSMCSIQGSPQLINQMREDDTNGQPLKLLTKTHHKRCPIIVHGTSCSSSDTSDTDDIPVCQKPRRDKTRRSFQRRDSGDHLSDTSDGSAIGATASLMGRKDRSRDSSRDEKLQEKTRRLSGDMKRRLSIEEKLSSELIKEKRRNSVVGAVKKSVSLILGRAYIVGDNTPDVTKLNTWNSCSDLSPNVKKALNTGSLSMRHLADRTVLGCMLARELRISRSEFLKESESLNRENRPRSRVIHVRSNDFSQLVDKFSTSAADDRAGVAVPDAGLRQRPREEGPCKIDINRNALNSLNQSSNRHDSGEKTTSSTMKTKCCSLV